MDILPQDIRQKVFSKKTIGGVSNEEVSHFLYELSVEFENLKHQNRSLSNQLIQSNNELNRYRDIENKLFQALEDAKSINVKTKENAEEEGRLIINKSKFQANQIMKEARSRAQKILEKTESYCRERLKATDEKVRVKKDEIELMENGRKRIIAELNHFMAKTMDKIKVLAEKTSYKTSQQPDNIPSKIDWDYNQHFDEMLKSQTTKKPAPTVTPQQTKPSNSGNVEKEEKPRSIADRYATEKARRSINEGFNKKIPSIHERFKGKASEEDDD